MSHRRRLVLALALVLGLIGGALGLRSVGSHRPELDALSIQVSELEGAIAELHYIALELKSGRVLSYDDLNDRVANLRESRAGLHDLLAEGRPELYEECKLALASVERGTQRLEELASEFATANSVLRHEFRVLASTATARESSAPELQTCAVLLFSLAVLPDRSSEIEVEQGLLQLEEAAKRAEGREARALRTTLIKARRLHEHLGVVNSILSEMFREERELGLGRLERSINGWFSRESASDYRARGVLIVLSAVLVVFLAMISVRLRRSFRELQAAKQASAEKSGFLANMSHEIRTPMNGIMTMANMLSEADLEPAEEECVHILGGSASSLLRIINDILDFSKLGADKLAIEKAEFDPVELIEDVADLIAISAHEKGLELVVNIGSFVPRLAVGDPGRIRQVLLNLVGNAVKFTSEGEVVVRASVCDAGEEQLFLLIAVEDSGIGIAEEDQLRLFGAFEQADDTTTRKFGGTGLGLSISRQLVALMGGQLEVTSELGQGAKFSLVVRVGKAVCDVVVEDQSTNGQAFVCVESESLADALQARLRSLEVPAQPLPKRCPPDILYASLKDSSGPNFVIIDETHFQRHYANLMPEDPLRNAKWVVVGKREMTDPCRLRNSWVQRLSKPVKHNALRDALRDDMNAIAKEPKPATPSSDAPADWPANVRILLVEDNPVNQRVAKLIFSRLGLSIELAANGQEAVAAVNEHAPDIIFMDCQMPVMDGYEATSEIRSLPEPACSIPIVAMTANALSGDRERCFDAGMNDYLSKPVDAGLLKEILTRYLKSESVAGSSSRA